MMKFYYKIFCFSIFIFLILLERDTAAQEDPTQLFQTGIYAEEVQGDLERALSFYNKIIINHPDSRSMAAKALLHIGYCYEKLGQGKAADAYKKLIDSYPDQIEAAATAKMRLGKINKPSSINPLMKFYFDRLGIDVLTATSPDAKFLAYTDWTTGNLIIKNHASGAKRKLTEANWSRSHEFALRPIWSHDGKFVAYSWYRQHYFTELRIVEVASGISQVVYSHPDASIAPQDWHPDGHTILCNITSYKGNRQVRLAIVSLNSGEVQEFLPLDINSRCMKFSPDGKYIAYDTQQPDNRHIFVLDLENFKPLQITSGTYGGRGYDAPIWSSDGKLLLFRSSRLGQYDLWALPMNNGKPNGESYLVQSDLTNAMVAMKGISHRTATKPGQSLISTFLARTSKNSRGSFVEDFSSPKLDSSWLVLEWRQSNIYDYASFGRYSLEENPGQLRYYLDPIMGEVYIHNYLPYFSGWYWLYPGLQINRILPTDSWELEARVTYSMIDVLAGRAFDLMICFDPEQDRGTALIISRSKDFGTNKLDIQLQDRGEITASNDDCLAPADSIGVIKFTYVFRISRKDTLIQVKLSDDDGISFRPALSGTLRSDLKNLPQLLILTGNCWFLPAGSYADWDYIRFSISE
ncbi:MAG: tetratricopeptide repeat protein [Candidatus Zhuqueibacterota bacterium]